VRPKPGDKITPVKTQARAATILPNFVGLIFQVHNGKSYTDVRITEDMVGHKLGEFSAYVKPDIFDIADHADKPGPGNRLRTSRPRTNSAAMPMDLEHG